MNKTILSCILLLEDGNNQKLISRMIEKFCPSAENLGVSSSFDQSCRMIEDLQPDVVIIDVKGTRGLAFDILDHFEERVFETIFTTASSGFAMKAIKYGVLDYLLQPISVTELNSAFEKAKKSRMRKLALEALKKEEKRMKFNPLSINQYFDKLSISTENGTLFVQVNDILWMEAKGMKTEVYLTGNRSFLSGQMLKSLEDQMPKEYFVRIHRSFLVNMWNVEEYHCESRKGKLIMKGNSVLNVAARRKHEVESKLTTSII